MRWNIFIYEFLIWRFVWRWIKCGKHKGSRRFVAIVYAEGFCSANVRLNNAQSSDIATSRRKHPAAFGAYLLYVNINKVFATLCIFHVCTKASMIALSFTSASLQLLFPLVCKKVKLLECILRLQSALITAAHKSFRNWGALLLHETIIVWLTSALGVSRVNNEGVHTALAALELKYYEVVDAK